MEARIGSPEDLHRQMEEHGSLGAHQHLTPPPLLAPPGGWPVAAALAAPEPADQQQVAHGSGGYLAMLAPHLPAAPGTGHSTLPAALMPLPPGPSGAAPGGGEGEDLQELIAGRALSDQFGRDSLAVAWAVRDLLVLQQEGLEAPRDLVLEVGGMCREWVAGPAGQAPTA